MLDQVGLLFGSECAGHDNVGGKEGDLALGDGAEVAGGAAVDFVTQRQITHHAVLRGLAEVNGLQPDLIQMAAAVPPVAWLAFLKRVAEHALSHREGQAGVPGAHPQHFSLPSGQKQQVATTEPPDTLGSILDGGGVLRGHQGADQRKIGDEFGGVRNGDFALEFETAIGVYGGFQVVADSHSNLLLNAVADDEEGGGGEPGGNSYK